MWGKTLSPHLIYGGERGEGGREIINLGQIQSRYMSKTADLSPRRKMKDTPDGTCERKGEAVWDHR